ncbi:MAG TPA: hypothetical protein VG253_19730 [Streptosporangiaceae bacterium]|nr:hypothetical protein [Streptosporangiaceae bacterium]
MSEATSADIQALGAERGHRTLVITRKGGKVVTIALAPGTARAIDLAVGERLEGPTFLAADGQRLGAARVVRKAARRAAHPLACPGACTPGPYPAGTDRAARMRISGASSASISAEPAKSAAAPISSRVIWGCKCTGRLFALTGQPRGHMHIGRSPGVDK